MAGGARGRQRGKGEGAVFKQANGLWCGSVELGRDGLGRRQRRVVRGRTKRDVMAKLREASRLRDDGLQQPDARIALASFLDRWLETVETNRTNATYRSYEQRVRLHIKPALGRKRLATLTPSDVQKLLDDMTKAGFSPRGVQHTHATIRAALSMAERWGLVTRNVAKLVTPVSARAGGGRAVHARRGSQIASGDRPKLRSAVTRSRNRPGASRTRHRGRLRARTAVRGAMAGR